MTVSQSIAGGGRQGGVGGWRPLVQLLLGTQGALHKTNRMTLVSQQCMHESEGLLRTMQHTILAELGSI